MSTFSKIFVLVGCLWGIGFVLNPDVLAYRKVRFAKPSVQKEPLQEKELAVQKVTTSRYTESWSLWAWNEKGWSVFGLFLVSRVHPFVGTRVGVQLSVYAPQGRVFHKLEEFPHKQLKYASDRLSLRVASHRLEGNREKGRMQVQWDGLGIKLDYISMLPGYRLYGGPVRLGSRRFMGVAWAPRLRVSGHLQLQGQKISFDGVGYAERSWQDVPHTMAKRWFNMRAIHGDYTVVATDWLPLQPWRPRHLSSLSIAYKGRWIVHLKPDEIQSSFRQKNLDTGSGYQVPQYIRYWGKIAQGGVVEVVIRAQQQRHRLDVLSHIPGWLRSLVQRLITKPFLFRYQNRVTLKITRPGREEQIDFPALSEWVFLNP